MTWQPISTAPKNGTTIRARGPDWGKPGAPFHYATCRWSGSEWVDGDELEKYSVFKYLTQWQPMEQPMPPAESTSFRKATLQKRKAIARGRQASLK